MKLSGNVAMVTGSSRGIGRAIAQVFVREGAQVIVNGRDARRIEEAVEEINSQHSSLHPDGLGSGGGCAWGMRADVGDRRAVHQMVDAVLEKFGRIDILVNNAAIYEIVSLREMTEEQWDRVLNINLKGAFNCTKAVLEPMIQQGHGSIIHIASDAGKTGGILPVAHYAASKAAIIAFTKSVAREFAPFGIRVNAVSPGVIRTEMTETLIKQRPLSVPLGRIGTPEDVAKAVLFLASEDASYITGEILDVNGGLLMD